MKAFEQPKFTLNPGNVTDTYGEFSLSPLEGGFGTTIGNSLRRVLLSSLPGLSVYAIEVDGARHEYSPLPGVIEDLTTIILNIKQIVIMDKLNDDSQIYNLRLDVQSKGSDGKGKEITAGDIYCPNGLEIVNKDLVICHIAAGGHISIKFYARSGRGFVTADDNKSPDMPIGVIPVDSSYSPIVKVNTTIEPCRVGHDASYEKLTLAVETNGSMTPIDAVALAAKILDDHFKVFEGLNEAVKDASTMKETVEVSKTQFVTTTLEDLDLSVRSYNCLKRSDIKTVNDLCNMKESELMTVRNLGKKSYKEILEKLAKLDLHLQKDDKSIDEDNESLEE